MTTSRSEGGFAAQIPYLEAKTLVAIERNAKSMPAKEYVWLKEQKFQPAIRLALIAAYERLHGFPA